MSAEPKVTRAMRAARVAATPQTVSHLWGVGLKAVILDHTSGHVRVTHGAQRFDFWTGTLVWKALDAPTRGHGLVSLGRAIGVEIPAGEDLAPAPFTAVQELRLRQIIREEICRAEDRQRALDGKALADVVSQICSAALEDGDPSHV